MRAVALDSDRGFARHAHDEFGIGRIVRGAQRSWSGRGWVEATAGDLITVNPGELHDGIAIGGPRQWRITYIDPAVVRSIGAELGLVEPEIASPAFRDPALALRFERLFAAVAAGDGLATEESLVDTVVALLAGHGAGPVVTDAASPAIDRARQWLDDEPARATSLVELAALTGIGRFRLLRGFAREVGTTPHVYQLQARTRLAARLLAAGGRPVDVAIAAGFADQSHLTRVFAARFGITPARFRRAHD